MNCTHKWMKYFHIIHQYSLTQSLYWEHVNAHVIFPGRMGFHKWIIEMIHIRIMMKRYFNKKKKLMIQTSFATVNIPPISTLFSIFNCYSAFDFVGQCIFCIVVLFVVFLMFDFKSDNKYSIFAKSKQWKTNWMRLE